MTKLLSPQEKKIIDEIIANLNKLQGNVLVGSAISSGNTSIFTWEKGSFTAKGNVSGEAIALQDFKGEWYVVEGDSVPNEVLEKTVWNRRNRKLLKPKLSLSIEINIGFTGLSH